MDSLDKQFSSLGLVYHDDLWHDPPYKDLANKRKHELKLLMERNAKLSDAIKSGELTPEIALVKKFENMNMKGISKKRGGKRSKRAHIKRRTHRKCHRKTHRRH